MTFQNKLSALRAHHEALLSKKNEPVEWGNGIYDKYKNPILTAEHTPLEWRYDFNEHDNPYLMQRIMMNATLNSGAIKWNDMWCRQPISMTCALRSMRMAGSMGCSVPNGMMIRNRGT